MVCVIAASGAYLYWPWLFRDMMDRVLAENDLEMLNFIATSILVLFIVRGLFFYGQSYYISFVGQRVITDIRDELFQKFQRLSLSYYDRCRIGGVMSTVTNDVATIQNALFEQLFDFVSKSALLIGAVCLLIYINWKLSFLILLAVLLISGVMMLSGRWIKVSGTVIQERLADINAFIQENISGIRIIKSFCREQYETECFRKQNELSFQAVMKNICDASLLVSSVEVLIGVAMALIAWCGGYEVLNDHMTTGTLIAFIFTYIANFIVPLRRLTSYYGIVQKAMAAVDRVFAFLDIEEEIDDRSEAIDLPPIKGNIEVKGVTFCYETGAPVLKNIDFVAKPGEMIAFVGPSGSGKSTITHLLSRFYDITEGQILIDGIDINDVTLESLRTQIGIVPQENLLFSATVWENIRYGRFDADDDEVIEAAKAAGAHEFIMELEAGYDTKIGERGHNLSEGQRQRIAIARAILKDPRILILDEATSALDNETEKTVKASLAKIMHGRTTFVIAQRLSSVVKADRIYVIDDGRIAESGTHEELMKLGGLYCNLYTIQQTVNKPDN